MPWNCLCSQKEKRQKLEISPPIIQPDDTKHHNLQLVPLKQKQAALVIPTGHYKFNDEKARKRLKIESAAAAKLQRNRRQSENKSGLVNGSNEIPVNHRPTFPMETRNSQVRKIYRNSQSTANDTPEHQQIPLVSISNDSQPSIKTANVKTENGKVITKQWSNVKFTINDSSSVTTATAGDHQHSAYENAVVSSSFLPEATVADSSAAICNGTSKHCPLSYQQQYQQERHHQLINNTNVNNTSQEDTAMKIDELQKETLGNYDEIPFIQIEEISAEPEDFSSSAANGHYVCTRAPGSIESIPFIEDDARRSGGSRSQSKSSTTATTLLRTHEDDHAVRFITLHPKNIGSHSSGRRNVIEAEKYLQLTSGTSRKHQTKILLEEIYNIGNNIQLSRTADHDFDLWISPKEKLCQVCHESLLIQPLNVLRCRSCWFVCHAWCLTAMPSIRYHDTSFIIFRKWLQAHEKLAFPTVYRYIYEESPQSVLRNQNQSHAENHIAHSECTRERRNSTNNNDENPESRNNQQRRGKPRRRTRSLERIQRNNQQKPQILSSSDNNITSIIEFKPKNFNRIGDVQHDQDNDGGMVSETPSPKSTSMGSLTSSPDGGEDDQNNNELHHEKIILQIVESRSNTIRRGNWNSTGGQMKTKEIESLSTDEVAKVTAAGAADNALTKMTTPPTIKLKSENDDDENVISNYQVVDVDVHQRPKSHDAEGALLIEEEDNSRSISPSHSNTKDNTNKNKVPEDRSENESQSNRTSHSSDSSDKTITSSSQVNIIPLPLTSRKIESLRSTNGNHTSLGRLSSSSTDHFADEVVDGYARVKLRKSQSVPASSTPSPILQKSSWKQQQYDETSQSIPKSQSNTEVFNHEPPYEYEPSLYGGKRRVLSEIYNDNKYSSSKRPFPIQKRSSQNHQHHPRHSDALRLHYVTQRILASILPSRQQSSDPAAAVNRRHSENEATTLGRLKDEYENEVITMLEQKHGKNYRLFDLESCISVITLEKLCELCKHIDSWLGSGKDKVVVLQDREDRQRLGAAIAAYYDYLDICSSNYPTKGKGSISGTSSEDLRAQNTIARNWLDLDIFSMKKFLEDFIGPLRIPSHKRYLFYFSGLLSGKIKMNAAPLYLKYISFESPPSWIQYEQHGSQSAEWNSFIKIYEGLRCVYTSDLHIIPITTKQFLYEIGTLRLRGDIMIRCYQIIEQDIGFRDHQETRELIFSAQFHTCAITSQNVSFPREQLDYACDDPRFPKDYRIALHFGKSSGVQENGYVFQSPLIRTEPAGDLARYDSVENFDPNSHTQGPLDGSLYATILKSPKSPLTTSRTTQSASALAQSEGQTHSVISPPPQFSNKKQQHEHQQYETVEKYPLSKITPLSNTVDRRDEVILRPPSRAPSRSDYNYVEVQPGTSQSSYRDTNIAPIIPGTKQITIVETFTTTSDVGRNATTNQNGKESVRSPLTLSMDSGISSSGVLNRRQQGSSVSPSSYPSQASPQEDRHRELDDILSDMLMTVQDIPDFGKNSQKIVRSHSVIPTSTFRYLQPAAHHNQHKHTQYIVKRSQSYGPPVEQAHQSSRNIDLAKDRAGIDQYDTSSTTTTLTPPHSESGRDTPTLFGNIGQQQHEKRHQQVGSHHEKREIFSTTSSIVAGQHQRALMASSSASGLQDQQQHQHRRHQQSPAYPQTVRTETSARAASLLSASEDDEENIPYHAREHSQPFSYGRVPPAALSALHQNGNQTDVEEYDARMIKAQSGLSSPSMVRKALGSSQTLSRKSVGPRNDFEEMLRERREKVMSEKYSISDKVSTIDGGYSNDKWSNHTSAQANGYNYHHEPLKRSNTMDGGFGRSTSTDGISGQTWLQLQQQKLRAKKEQQERNSRQYFEETIYNEIRNRPLRSRAAVPRYDGYASDTAAFADEMDYRMPLHVQTPYQANRLPERNYQTITTTTTTLSQKERPFVAAKRAHDQARQNSSIGSPPLSPLSVLNSSPNGFVTQTQQNQNGLLSMADSTTRNGHARLESENDETLTNFQISSSLSPTSSTNTTASTTCGVNINNTIVACSTENIINNNSNNNHNGTISVNDNRKFNENHPAITPSSQSSVSNNKYNSDACGQLVLDKLLASLAIESSRMDERHCWSTDENKNLEQNNKTEGVTLRRSETLLHINDSPVQIPAAETRSLPTTKSLPNGILNGYPDTISHKTNPPLSDVIADLQDYTRYESMRQKAGSSLSNGFSDSLSSHSRNSHNSFHSTHSSNHQNSISTNHPNGNLHNHQHLHTTNGSPLKQLISEPENSSSISPSLSDRSNAILWHNDQVREDSFSSYRSETEPELSIAGSPRPETPAFPVTPRTPHGLHSNGNVSPSLPPKSPTTQRKDLYSGTIQKGNLHVHLNQNETISCYTSRRNSNTSNANSEPQEVAPHLVKFVRDSSKYWYKPTISREEAVALLRNANPGTFLVRDSTTFKNAFGLVLRVAHPPPGVQSKGPAGDELVRHFLVEPTSRGVRLKGCANEPVFTSLSALVYQHSITPLALPCRLIIPDRDIQATEIHSPTQKQLLSQGAACNVLYLFSSETESLTGDEAVRKAVGQLYAIKPLPNPSEVHFKVSGQGITLTDVTRQRFFRKHYAAHTISFFGFDPERRLWSVRAQDGEIPVNNKTIFAFVARRSAVSTDNQCHVFCDLQANQPATAIISFANKVLPTTEKIYNIQNI